MNLRPQFAVVLVCLFFAGWLPKATAQDKPLPPDVVRGPYLQLGTPTSVVVRWRTPETKNSRVRFGTVAGQLDSIVDDPAETTEHEVRLGGLDSDTRYFYSIGTTERDLAGDDAEHFFVTAPDVGSQKPIRVWVLGDSGTGNQFIKDVRDQYIAFTADRRTDLWLMLGDNAYGSGSDTSHQRGIFDVFPSFLSQSVLWPSLGNHDALESDPMTQVGPYFDIFTLPAEGEAGGVASGTESFYSFDHANVHFICIDSSGSDRSLRGKMLTWIKEDCAATTQEWMVAYWHHPPYSKGTHNSDRERTMVQMRERVLPILEDAGVDLVLTGHSHNYERSYLVRGHYGHSRTVSRAMILDCADGREDGDGSYEKMTVGDTLGHGTVYIVAGSSGGQHGFGRNNHPIKYLSSNENGSLILDFDGSRVNGQFLTDAGVVFDNFSIVKRTERTREEKDCRLANFRRGDANGDGSVNISDVLWILNAIYQAGPPGPCHRASDVTDDSAVNLEDAMGLFSHLLRGEPSPASPYPDCGQSMEFGPLSCIKHPECRR